MREEHPQFSDATAAVAFLNEGQPGAYASQDSRSRLMESMGFTIPPRFDELAGDAFFSTVSQEQTTVLDTDVIVWSRRPMSCSTRSVRCRCGTR